MSPRLGLYSREIGLVVATVNRRSTYIVPEGSLCGPWLVLAGVVGRDSRHGVASLVSVLQSGNEPTFSLATASCLFSVAGSDPDS